MNFSTSVAGGVRVEIQDENGTPIKGYTMAESVDAFGDELERVVRWKAGTDVRSLAGSTVRLVFELRDADLYSIRFR